VRARAAQLKRRRSSIFSAAAVLIIVVTYVIFAVVRPGGQSRECVNKKSMKVAATSHCRSSAGNSTGTDPWVWYWGPSTQVGGTARGGSFSNPDEQGSDNQTGSGGSSEDEDEDSGGGGGGGGSSGGGDDDG
jgi:uncharacterized membrane protein YgcG